MQHIHVLKEQTEFFNSIVAVHLVFHIIKTVIIQVMCYVAYKYIVYNIVCVQCNYQCVPPPPFSPAARLSKFYSDCFFSRFTSWKNQGLSEEVSAK